MSTSATAVRKRARSRAKRGAGRAATAARDQAAAIATLSDAELIATLLRRRAEQLPAISLATLHRESAWTLRRRGFTPVQTSMLLAAVEVGVRLAWKEAFGQGALFDRPAATARYLSLRYHRDSQEVMGAIFLDTRNRLILEREIFRGTMHRAAVEPRQIFKIALEVGATSLLLFHTHPSAGGGAVARVTRWAKKSSPPLEDDEGKYELHWYEHPGIGRVELKRKQVAEP